MATMAFFRTEPRSRGCVPSKRRYREPRAAKEVRKRCEARGSGPLRCYQCDLCRGWHLTSKGAR